MPILISVLVFIYGVKTYKATFDKVRISTLQSYKSRFFVFIKETNISLNYLLKISINYKSFSKYNIKEL